MAEVKVKVKPKSVQRGKPIKAGSTNKSHGLFPSKSIVNYPKIFSFGVVHSVGNCFQILP